MVPNVAGSTLLGKPVAKVTPLKGPVEIFDAVSGNLITPIRATLAQAIAEADYSPNFPVLSVVELMENNIDYRGALPVWQVNFADDENTSIYVSPTEARVVGRRSSTWRLFDFFWMLHIMDYDERTDVNNPLLRVATWSVFAMAISGAWLLIWSFKRRKRKQA